MAVRAIGSSRLTQRPQPTGSTETPVPLNSKTVEYWNGKYNGQIDPQGQPHGHGRIIWTDGVTYEGNWDKGKITTGTIKYVNGASYTGEFIGGKREGKGAYTWSDGANYQGEWKNGKRNGKGIMKFPDGRKYVGKWKDGTPHGQGIITFSDGSKNEGTWVKGTLIGSGAKSAE